jgi:hypothetical protein
LRKLQRWNRAAIWNQEIRAEWAHLSHPARSLDSSPATATEASTSPTDSECRPHAA